MIPSEYKECFSYRMKIRENFKVGDLCFLKRNDVYARRVSLALAPFIYSDLLCGYIRDEHRKHFNLEIEEKIIVQVIDRPLRTDEDPRVIVLVGDRGLYGCYPDYLEKIEFDKL